MIDKLKRTPGIFLVGFMGCGKTVVGKELAGRLGWNFADTDADIEAGACATINQIFDELGEQEFRRLETEAIHKRVRAIQSGRPTVVALGGGAFGQPQNFELIGDNGISVWLDCPLALIRHRLAGATDRPLARDPHKFDLLYYARREVYCRADYRIEITGNDPLVVVEAILALPVF